MDDYDLDDDEEGDDDGHQSVLRSLPLFGFFLFARPPLHPWMAQIPISQKDHSFLNK